MEKNEQAVYNYRKTKLDGRKLLGLDLFVNEYVPGWLKTSVDDSQSQSKKRVQTSEETNSLSFFVKRKKKR